MIVREERAGDLAAVRAVNRTAFGRPEEADLADSLRAEGVVICSLVAEIERTVAGHILFSRMWIDRAGGSIPAVALAPMAVQPAHQRQGIGAALVREGLDRLRRMRERIVLVLGHPDYYPRFGFSAERASSLISPFPPEAFMAIELENDALAGVNGRVRYPRPFGI